MLIFNPICALLLYGFLQNTRVFCEQAEIEKSQNSIEVITNAPQIKAVTTTEAAKRVCPDSKQISPLFSLPCESSKDCAIVGPQLLCCGGRCTVGIDPPKPEVMHTPLLFGLVDRTCPDEPLAEFWDVKECTKDSDCTPRICCQDKLSKGSNGRSFCRTAAPKLDKIPFAKQMFAPLKTLMSYMQCTAPPPPVLDIFPKVCSSPIDCFPNLCCQEGDRKVCRPPKRSILTFMAGVLRRMGAGGFGLAKKLIQRIN